MIGTSLGPYKVIEQIGAGGMGEVYLGVDTRLGRKVAIKVLPEEYASDPERLARFEQEARAAAALNHPHIAVVHDVGFEEEAGVHYMVQEYLEGAPLRETLAKGALPLKKALGLATEVSEALAAAHGAGIVHRDLKPDNIFVTDSGHAKVLDFGLAKLTELGGPDGSRLSMSPTMLGTVAGQVMGTAGYMAPEQASGSPDIDHRADLFAFGCVLYEMAAGKQPFAGRSVAETLSRIQHDEAAPLSDVDASAPAELQRIIHKCLAKDADERYQTAPDLRVDLRALAADVEAGQTRPVGAADGASVAEVVPTRRAVTIAAAAGLMMGLALAALAFWGGWLGFAPGSASAPGSVSAPVSRLSIPLPDELSYSAYLTNFPNRMAEISPDGTRIAFVAGGADERLLYVRALDDLTLRSIPGTDGAVDPFFSPDGRTVYFFTPADELKKVGVAVGSEPLLVAREVNNATWAFGTWKNEDEIIYSSYDSGLFVVAAEGPATPRPLTTPDNEAHVSPQVLPGSRHVIFYSAGRETTAIQVLALDEPGATPTTLIEGASNPIYLESGHLLYIIDGRLQARRFDPVSLEFAGPAFSVPLDVDFTDRGAYDPTPQLAVSGNGTLVYVPAAGRYERRTELVWVDRDGSEEPIDTLDMWRPHLQLSPDDRRLALEYREGPEVLLSIYDMERRLLETTVATMSKMFVGSPVWTRDGGEIITSHSGSTTSSMEIFPTDGSGFGRELFTAPGSFLHSFNFSTDGRLLAYNYYRPDTGADIGIYEFGREGSEGRAIDVLAGSDPAATPRISPDGRAIAYAEWGGRYTQVWLKPYPEGPPRRVTSDSGGSPLWSRDGTELFFVKNGAIEGTSGSRDSTEIWAVDVATDPELTIGDERLLFRGPLYNSGTDSGYGFDVAADGRFLMTKLDPDDYRITELVVVQNWFEELRRRENAGR